MSKKKSASKWTPDISIDGNKGQDRDDEIIKDLAKKLGVEGDEIPEEFAADGLDYLLSVPKYGAEKREKPKKEEHKPSKKQKTKKKAPVVEEEPEEEPEEEMIEQDDDEEEEQEEEEIQDPKAVIEALKKQKEEKKKAARPPTEIDQIFSSLGEKKTTKKAKKQVFLGVWLCCVF